jgi:hypothetical protein
LLLLFSACAGGFVVVDGGPPPYAPANGYRHRHPVDHVVLVYSANLAVYSVSGYHDCFYDGDRYYRLRSGTWYYAPHIDGPWAGITYTSIPPGLHHKYKENHGQKKKHGHGHDHHDEDYGD